LVPGNDRPRDWKMNPDAVLVVLVVTPWAAMFSTPGMQDEVSHGVTRTGRFTPSWHRLKHVLAGAKQEVFEGSQPSFTVLDYSAWDTTSGYIQHEVIVLPSPGRHL